MAAGLVLAAAPSAAGQPAEAERAVVWAVGDAATPSSGARRLAATIRAARPDRFLYLGDVYEYGTAAEFERNYDPLYGPLGTITEPTPGNHEWANRFSGYYPYWREKKGRRQPPWSSIRLAGWELVDLNSEAAHGPGRGSCAGSSGPWPRRATAASPSGTGRASPPAPGTATRPTWRRSGAPCAARPGRCWAVTITTSSACGPGAGSPSTWPAPGDGPATGSTGATAT